MIAKKNAVNIDVYSVLAYFGFPTGGERGILYPFLIALWIRFSL